MQCYGVQSQWKHLQNIPAPMAQGTLRKGGWKDCKRQRSWEFSVGLCLLIMSGVTPRVSPTWLSKNELNKYDNNKHAKLDREPMSPQPYTKNYRQLRMARDGRWPSPEKCQMASLQIYIQVAFYGPDGQVVIRNIYVYPYTYIYACKLQLVKKKRPRIWRRAVKSI